MSPKQSSVIGGLSNRLRRDISLGLIRPGEKLNIEALKREHKVSHPSVREALSLLVGEGYVASEDQKGFRVLESSVEEQRDVTRVRAELECLAFGWSLANASTDWRASVVAAHHALSEVETELAKDPVAYALEWDERNRNFHFAILANCGSPKLLEIIAAQYDLSRRYRLRAHSNRLRAMDRAEWIERSAAEHLQLKEAALTGDTTRGVGILKNHINKAAADFSAVLIPIETCN